ncbi:DotI/IcmL family type IV secretion protein [Legionella sp. WA2022007384]
MKKNIVCGALFNLICTQVYAVQTPDTISEKISTRAKLAQSQKSNATTKPQSVEINCDYRISGDTQKLDKTLIINWAKYAVLHSFNFDFPSFDTQMKNLRACYTENGWLGFTNALKDSGNINSIKTQNLTVSSTLDGEVQVIDDQENQWKMTVPIKVFYKNDQEEITHFLNVYIIISWRNAFKLGIVQMITTPRSASISIKATSLREALKSLSLGVSDQINNVENLQQLGTSFLTSLFVFNPKTVFSEMDRVLNQPGLCLKSEHSNTKFLQHLIDAPKNQGLNQGKAKKTQVAKLTSKNALKHVKGNPTEKPAQANGIEWLNHQFIAIKSDIFDTKLPKLLAYFKENELAEFYPALTNLDNLKIIKTQNPVNQQRLKEPQLSKNKNNQTNTSLPIHIAPQNNKNQINQLLNVNLTLGRKISGELVILQMKTLPSVLPLSSNRAAPLASNAILLSNRADPIQKIPQNNKVQLVQNGTPLKPSQIPKMTFNKSSEIINCDYKIPDEMTKIDEDLVIKWAEYAATQSFDFNSISITSQLKKLESCYTAKGWENFKNALDKSGNLEAIKTQNFTMTSKVDGQIKLIKTKNNQWNIELPLQVVYQNNQVNVTQFLNVNLTMGRKLTGEFGIMRIIAALKEPANTDTGTNNQSPITQSNQHTLQNTQQTAVEQTVGLIDCDYKTPVDVRNINQATILAWAEYAATKSFNFDSESIDTQLKKLQSCYTEQGWNEFINALEKSGNIKAFKTKKLSAISQIDGAPQLIESRDNQWTLSLPLKINYQFENGNVTQLLKIDLTIGRKNTGDLGIIQLNSTLRS